MQGGTFTISNGGVYGSMLSTPILNAPQSGILGMHRIEERPVVRGGQIVIRPMMYLALELRSPHRRWKGSGHASWSGSRNASRTRSGSSWSFEDQAMSSDKIVDLASYRRDGAAPLVADFWELATDGATCGGRLAVGKTSLSEVAHLIGIQPAEIDLDDTGVPGLFYWQHGELVWNFDASRRFVGLNFGGEPDNTMRPIVQLAVSRRELSTGDQLEIPPELELVPGIPLRLRGRRLDQFATLPRFLGSMHDVKIASTAVRGVEKCGEIRA